VEHLLPRGEADSFGGTLVRGRNAKCTRNISKG